MSKPSLVILAVATLVLIIAAAYISRQQAPQREKTQALLLPALTDKINAIDHIHIAAADGQLDIKRQDDEWVIEQADDYPARFDKVKQTILALSELRLLAEKTSNPARYDRLGVEDINTAKARSRLLTLNAAGTPLASLIIGAARRSKAPADKPGLYVRRPDSNKALLVAGKVDVSVRPADWFEQDLLDISSSDIKTIRIAPLGQPPIELARSDSQAALALKTIPAGKQAQSDSIISQLATLLQGLFAEAVKSETTLRQAEKIADFSVRTFKGLAVDGQLLRQGKGEGEGEDKNGDAQYYALFNVTAEPAAEAEEETETAEQAEADKGPSVTAQAEQLQQRLAGWGYVLPPHKLDLLTKTLDELTREQNAAAE